MNISKKTLWITLALAIVLVFAYMVLKPSQEQIETIADISPINTEIEGETINDEKTEEVSPVIFEPEADYYSTVRNFTEQYGSWSNQSKSNVPTGATQDMMSIGSSYYLGLLNESPPNGGYWGITTRVLNVDADFSKSPTTAKVSVQRIIETVSGEERTYGTALVVTVLSGDKWQIDDVIWPE